MSQLSWQGGVATSWPPSPCPMTIARHSRTTRHANRVLMWYWPITSRVTSYRLTGFRLCLNDVLEHDLVNAGVPHPIPLGGTLTRARLETSRHLDLRASPPRKIICPNTNYPSEDRAECLSRLSISTSYGRRQRGSEFAALREGPALVYQNDNGSGSLANGRRTRSPGRRRLPAVSD